MQRVSANTQVLRSSGDSVGERARAPTFAPNAPRGPTSLLRVPLQMRPQHLSWPQYRPPRSGPSRKTQQGRRPAACKGRGGAGLGKTGCGAVRRGPPSAPVSGATGRGAVPPPTAPTAAPSPTSGRRPRRLRPGAPAHPGSDSAAGTGPPARGTFSSRPTTGVGRSHPETWLRRAGLGGEPTAWGRGGEGTRDQPPSRTGTIRAPGLAGGRARRLRWRRRRPGPRSPAAPGPELASYSARSAQNIQRTATVPSPGPSDRRRRGRRRPRLLPLGVLDALATEPFSRDDDGPGR